MLCCLLLEELAILTIGDDFYHIILGCRSVETMFEGFPDDRMPWRL
jgi:hypothetical protein